MVTILSVGLIALTGIEQERTTFPFRCTEQAPHCATPQPYLVPVRPTCSRITHNSGVPGSTCTSLVLPLIFSLATFLSFGFPPRGILYAKSLVRHGVGPGSSHREVLPGEEVDAREISCRRLRSDRPLNGVDRLRDTGGVVDHAVAEHRDAALPDSEEARSRGTADGHSEQILDRGRWSER